MAERTHIDAARLEKDKSYAADVAIIGSGAGGGVAAEILARAGLQVVLIEEGGYWTAKDFTGREGDAYRTLYWDAASRKTKDKAITLLQGRAVGGGTVVNWTASFRTPPETLSHWAEMFDVKETNAEDMTPWFERTERRFSVAPWEHPPNENNAVLARGCERLGWPHGIVPRNVRGCWNIGYCGFGCPTNAKQSMLVTTIPAALDRGAILISHARAHTIETDRGRAANVQCLAIDSESLRPTGRKIRVHATHIIVAGGGINGPGLLLRSRLPDPHQRLGKRTFLHPVVALAGELPEEVKPFEGAPQSVYSDAFLWRDGVTGKAGYKLEVPPLFPVQAAISIPLFGNTHAQSMARLPYTHAVIALVRDGFSPDFTGGRVVLQNDGSPVLDYQTTAFHWEGFQHAYLSMAELSFAAGAKSVFPVHREARPYQSWREARQAIRESLSMRPPRALIFSAHIMGGCAMSKDARLGVVDSFGRHHQVEGLSVFDGSVFPTSLGVNPQISIYALVARNAARLAESLTGQPVDLS
ncbi:MAG: GMC family oxidoreductase [Rhodospirillaceae bacterium]|nr:MAG: GMC family oxidoreductase [Rhodospirillaceae bacterium]